MYRWGEHTAGLELAIEAPTQEAVFEEALAAYAELVGPSLEGEQVVHSVEVEAPDRAALLAAWLDELVFLAETEAFVPERAEIALSPGAVSARVVGHHGDPPHVVKAVTYHELEFSPAGAGWQARVVLDV